jgi:hypothetical protein
MINEIRNSLKNIIGTICWDAHNIVTGTLELSLGGIIGQELDDDIICVGQHDILIWCSWRIDDVHDVLCGSGDSDETIARTVIQLVGDAVIDIEIFPPVWDTDIIFSSGKKLKIFCDYNLFTNWDFGTMDTLYFIGIGNKIEKGKRQGIIADKIFDPHILPPIDIEKRIESVKTKIPYETLLEIAKSIKEKYSND